MPPETVCAAHQILYDNVIHLRDNQAQLYDLARESSSRAAQTSADVCMLKATTEAGFIALNDRQDEADRKQAAAFDRMAKIIAEKNRNQWTPRAIIALAAAVIGPSGVAAWAIFMGVPK